MVNPADKAEARGGARARSADRRAVRAGGSAGCCAATSATPTSPRSRRWTRSCRAFPSPPSSPALALFFSVLLGVPLGVISAVRQNTALDYVLRVVSLSGLSLPSFWLGLLILMGFVHYLGWIPIYTEQAGEPLARAGAAQHPGGRGRLPRLGADHAADALLHAGGAAPGLHPHRARQGRLARPPSTTITRCATRCCRSSPSSASRRRS